MKLISVLLLFFLISFIKADKLEEVWPYQSYDKVFNPSAILHDAWCIDGKAARRPSKSKSTKYLYNRKCGEGALTISSKEPYHFNIGQYFGMSGSVANIGTIRSIQTAYGLDTLPPTVIYGSIHYNVKLNQWQIAAPGTSDTKIVLQPISPAMTPNITILQSTYNTSRPETQFSASDTGIIYLMRTSNVPVTNSNANTLVLAKGYVVSVQTNGDVLFHWDVVATVDPDEDHDEEVEKLAGAAMAFGLISFLGLTIFLTLHIIEKIKSRKNYSSITNGAEKGEPTTSISFDSNQNLNEFSLDRKDKDDNVSDVEGKDDSSGSGQQQEKENKYQEFMEKMNEMDVSILNSENKYFEMHPHNK